MNALVFNEIYRSVHAVAFTSTLHALTARGQIPAWPFAYLKPLQNAIVPGIYDSMWTEYISEGIQRQFQYVVEAFDDTDADNRTNRKRLVQLSC